MPNSNSFKGRLSRGDKCILSAFSREIKGCLNGRSYLWEIFPELGKNPISSEINVWITTQSHHHALSEQYQHTFNALAKGDATEKRLSSVKSTAVYTLLSLRDNCIPWMFWIISQVFRHSSLGKFFFGQSLHGDEIIENSFRRFDVTDWNKVKKT